MALSAPEPLGECHYLAVFDSGEPSLDDWLRKRALANQVSGASRTFVACDANRVAGYYALASGAVTVASAPGRFKRNMPDPIPVVLLGRLAVDRSWQGRGLGRSLFRDAAMRVSRAADVIGIRGIIVHALSEDARKFYLALGFVECPGEPLILAVALGELRDALSKAHPTGG
jgi:GNAT superfamily N-acetyltransferase